MAGHEPQHSVSTDYVSALASGAADEEEETPLQHTVWCDTAWLTHFPLTEDTVMDYFARSPFYDRQCNNEVIRMQRNLQLPAAPGGAGMDDWLRSMVGVEYVSVGPEERPPLPVEYVHNLFVIRKQWRRAPDIADVLASYYVLNGSVYQAPTVVDVVLGAVEQSLQFLADAPWSNLRS
ncbi:hypothetical protein CDCA_CDCA02G0573 [Cyanidium caldarium]|uniref:Mediator of RNA polymerase II transcription subunit 6 n=1 Tax=Cyanidium caldarium TaxID=2771 RepID=A0AAV9IR98_CYACA|nr:hypothetical protein CDCA_CDCA02G0573 [Cyanidium caldarium]|eukprot:ctg_376.g201